MKFDGNSGVFVYVNVKEWTGVDVPGVLAVSPEEHQAWINKRLDEFAMAMQRASFSWRPQLDEMLKSLEGLFDEEPERATPTIRRRQEATAVNGKLSFPRADKKSQVQGYTIDPAYLTPIWHKLNKILTFREIEQFLLALEAI